MVSNRVMHRSKLLARYAMALEMLENRVIRVVLLTSRLSVNRKE